MGDIRNASERKEISLDITHPELCKEWNYDKNLIEFKLKPDHVTYGSGRKVYWKCPNYNEIYLEGQKLYNYLKNDFMTFLSSLKLISEIK